MEGKKQGVNALELVQKTGRNIYEHLTVTIGISAIWSIISGLLVFVVYLTFSSALNHPAKTPADMMTLLGYLLVACVITGALIWGPVNSGLIYFAYKTQENEAGMGGLISGIRRRYALSAKVYAVVFFGLTFLLGDIFLAFSINQMIMKIAGITAVYFLLFFALMNLYIPGLIVFQEENTVGRVFRKAYLLTLDNAWTNVIAAVTLLIVASVFLVLPFLNTFLMFLLVSFFMFFGGFLLFYQTNLYQAVMERYDD